VRVAAVEALGNVRSKEAVPELAHLVDDPPRSVLIQAVDRRAGKDRRSGGHPALAHGLVIERQGVSFLPKARLRSSPSRSAVEPLIRILQDRIRLLRMGQGEQPRAGRHVCPRGAGARRSRRPAGRPALIAKLKYKDRIRSGHLPPALERRADVRRQRPGRMRAAQAAPAVQALVSTASAQDEEVTTTAAEALVWMGDRAQAAS